MKLPNSCHPTHILSEEFLAKKTCEKCTWDRENVLSDRVQWPASIEISQGCLHQSQSQLRPFTNMTRLITDLLTPHLNLNSTGMYLEYIYSLTFRKSISPVKKSFCQELEGKGRITMQYVHIQRVNSEKK